jgi:hypothetical protein
MLNGYGRPPVPVGGARVENDEGWAIVSDADLVCTLCGADAHLAADGVYRHTKDALQDASTYCDRYGYPIEVRKRGAA